MSYLKKLAASRMDKEIKRLLSNNEFEKAMDIYRKHNIVRNTGISSDYTNYASERELNELLHYSPQLDLSKVEQKEYLNRVKGLDRKLNRATRSRLKTVTNAKPGDEDYYSKQRTHNPLKDWKNHSPKEEPGNNYVYGHHGGYHTLDLAINRQNKAVQSVLGTSNLDDGRMLYTAVKKVEPGEVNKTMDEITRSPNEYSMNTSIRYGDVPGAVAFHSKGKAYHNKDDIGFRGETPLKGKRLVDDVKNGKVDMKLVRHDYDNVGKHSLSRVGLTPLEANAVKRYRLKDNRYSEAIKQTREREKF